MKTFKCLVTTVLAFTLFSCQDNSESPENNKHEKVSLHVNISIPSTKADLEAVPYDYVSEIGENSYIFVLNSANLIVGEPVKFTPNGSLNEMTVETTSEARSILFLANAVTGFNPTGYATLNSLEKEIFMMQDLAPDTSDDVTNPHGVKNATMYNTDLPLINQDTPEKWSVDVTIAPIVSRFEILGIGADAELSEEEIAAGFVGIKQYTLTGLFINDIFQGMRLNGDPAGIQMLNGNITRTTSDWSCDVFEKGAPGRIFTPENGAWAYHIAPSTGIVPQIVLVLEDIEFEDGTKADKLYVTVKGYEESGNADHITTFKAGNVYQIEHISFNHTHLSTEVDPDVVHLTATINVKSWKINLLIPVI